MEKILDKRVWGLTITNILLVILLFIGISLSSCTKRLDPSAIEGRWYSNGKASYIDFNNSNFTGRIRATDFSGTYRISKKNIKFNFYSEINTITKFQNNMKKVDRYRVLNNGLYLYGPNFEYFFVK